MLNHFKAYFLVPGLTILLSSDSLPQTGNKSRKQTGICSRNQVKAAIFWASRKALVNTMLAAIFKIGNEVKNGLKSYQPWLRLSHWNRMPWIPEETLLDRSHLSSNTDFPTLRKHSPQRPLEMEDDKLLKLMLTNYSVQNKWYFLSKQNKTKKRKKNKREKRFVLEEFYQGKGIWNQVCCNYSIIGTYPNKRKTICTIKLAFLTVIHV